MSHVTQNKSVHAQQNRSSLYPPINPYDKGFLDVDKTHRIYWEVSGNPKGIPALFLHGGPGAGASIAHRRFFDPKIYKLVIFDQRGAGRSTPYGEVRENTTELLISDIEMLRKFLHIDRWHIFGGSWGSTLALSYAQAHPEQCMSLILRGIFLMRQKEIDWFMYGIRQFFPGAWEKFAHHVGEGERDDLLTAYYKRLTDPDPAIHLPAAKAWSLYESTCSTLYPHPQVQVASADERYALGLARLEAHYFLHNRFTPEDQLLQNIDEIRNIPGIIIQGRYDVICPIASAYDLHRAWPEADYVVIADAGHSAMEAGIQHALLQATERFKHIA